MRKHRKEINAGWGSGQEKRKSEKAERHVRERVTSPDVSGITKQHKGSTAFARV